MTMEKEVVIPPIRGASDKERKYDRQLRLWAAAGQAALESAHVLLLNSGSGVAGCETLKNLILPGVGRFTIVDDAIVSPEDLGVNFFLEEESLGRSRASETVRFLQELNPDVQGFAIESSAEDFVLKHDLTPYTVVLIVGPVSLSSTLLRLSEYAWDRQIALLYLHCYGFYSQVSVQLPSSFPIVDTHPAPHSTEDLRLLHPWPQLADYMHRMTANLETMSDHDHGHVPYLVLLLYYVRQWKDSHDGKIPENYKDKSLLRDHVSKQMRRNNPEMGEENFEEAVAAALKSLNPPSVPSGLKEIFNHEFCKTLNAQTANFWLIANAIEQFTAKHGVLPLPGGVPDMKAVSADYVELQNIYKSKARQDVEEVTEVVRQLEAALDRQTLIHNGDIEAFCKGAGFVKVIHGSRLRIPGTLQRSDWTDRASYVVSQLQDENSSLPIYVAIMALDQVLDQTLTRKRDAATVIEVVDNSTTQARVEEIIDAFLQHLRLAEPDLAIEEIKERIEKTMSEVLRAAPGELHNIASLTGGMVSQEVIKIITRQYIPIDNVLVFDGIKSQTATFRI